MFFLLGVLGLFIFAFFLIPKGYPIHEILHLPIYWWKVSSIPLGDLRQEKIRYGANATQYYLEFPAEEEEGKAPQIFIYFHGGAWRYGRPEMFKLVASTLVKLGYTVILPSCRRTPGHNYDAIREDLTALLLAVDQRYSRSAPSYILGGMSSGGNLAAHLFYDRAVLKQQGFDNNRLKALLLLGAPLDLGKMPQNRLVTSFAGKKDSTLFKQANVQNHLGKSEERPVLLIHGQSDGLVPFASAQSFIMALQKRQGSGIKVYSQVESTHLDVAAWACGENEFKSTILAWLQTEVI